MRLLSSAALAALAALAACDSDDDDMRGDGSLADAAVDADAMTSLPFELAPVAPPTPPAPVDLGECSAGAMRDESPVLTRCVPFGGGESPTCTGDEGAFPGVAGCTSVSRTCPSDRFPPAPSGRVLYVAPDGMGTGSREAPYGSIAAALTASTSGATVLLAPGRYEETIEPPAGVVIEGACASGVVIAPMGEGTAADAAAIGVRTGAVELRHVTIEAERRAITVAPMATLTIEGVVVERARGTALSADRATVHAAGFVVRDVGEDEAGTARAVAAAGGSLAIERADLRGYENTVSLREGCEATFSRVRTANRPGHPQFGGGVISIRSRLTIEDAIIEHLSQSGITSYGGGELVARRVLVRDVDLNTGRGVQVGEDTSALLERVEIEATSDAALLAQGEVVARDLVLTGTRGLSVPPPGVLTIERALLRDSHSLGLRVPAGGRLIASDVRIFDVSPDAAGMFGYGVELQSATAEMSRVEIVRAHSAALTVLHGSELTIDDLVVRDTSSQPASGDLGSAIAMQEASSVSGARWRFDGNREAGIVVRDLSTLRVTDLDVRDTRTNETTTRNGMALYVADASAEVERGYFEGNKAVGAFCRGGTILLRDSEILHVEPSGDPTVPRAIGVQDGCVVELQRVWVHDQVGTGLVVIGEGARLVGDEVALTDIETSTSCVRDDCTAYGIAAATFDQGAIELTRFAIERSGLCGVYASSAGELALSDGRVADCGVGVCMDGEPELSGLTDGVLYERNGQALSTIHVPVPEATFSGR